MIKLKRIYIYSLWIKLIEKVWKDDDGTVVYLGIGALPASPASPTQQTNTDEEGLTQVNYSAS